MLSLVSHLAGKLNLTNKQASQPASEEEKLEKQQLKVQRIYYVHTHKRTNLER